jgi:hypothetical protein
LSARSASGDIGDIDVSRAKIPSAAIARERRRKQAFCRLGLEPDRQSAVRQETADALELCFSS